MSEYTVSENDQFIEVCLLISGPEEILELSFTTFESSATGKSVPVLTKLYRVVRNFICSW